MSDNPPAFPACNEANVNGTMGMTLRDWFAGQFLIGCAAFAVVELDSEKQPPEETLAGTRKVFAREAYAIADAMLAARTPSKRETVS